jgi:hypothetical protein
MPAPRRYYFWTAYRRLYVETCLARGESRDWIAEKLGKSRAALDCAISHYRLKPRHLLEVEDRALSAEVRP